jgi:rare lipoprotein A
MKISKKTYRRLFEKVYLMYSYGVIDFKKLIHRIGVINKFYLVVLLLITSNANAFTTEASYYTVASCLREGTSGICANGERLYDNAYTCASWDFKFNTVLKVTNIRNNKWVIVRVNDRGPNKRLYRGGRRIDLSLKAMRAITKGGLCQVRVEEIK